MKKNNNITIKIISILFAIILWSYVMDQENPEITKEIQNIKIELLNTEYLDKSNIVIEDTDINEITVKVKGRRNDIINITENDIVAEADIAGYQEGEHKVPIKVTIPTKNENLEDFYPKTILLKLDKVVERQIPVKFNVIGNVKSGYVLGESELKQTNIIIRGPRNKVNLVSEAKVTLKLNEENKNINATLPVKLIDINGKEIVSNIDKEPNVVDVSVPIYKVKTVSLNANISGSPIEGYQITSIKLSPSTIKIKGYEEELLSINSLKTEEININGLNSTLDTNIAIIVPKGISLIGDSKEVDVIVNIEKIIDKTFEYSFDELSIYNIPKDLNVDLSNNSVKINISVQGIESRIRNLNKEDIKPYIKIDGLNEGSHEVEVKVYKPYGIDIIKIDPIKINATLYKIEDSNNDG